MKAEKNISSSEIVKKVNSESKKTEEKKSDEQSKSEDPNEKLLDEIEKIPEKQIGKLLKKQD